MTVVEAEGRGALLELAGVGKRFPGVQALDDVRLSVDAGEVVALIGENGAGKSTLVKILTGIYQPDDGEVRLAGQPVRFASPLAAAASGISAIHQETVMFDELSVAENIFLGHQPVKGRSRLIDWRDMRTRAQELLQQVGIDVAPETPVKSLSIAERHLVTVAKALSQDAKVLILDEPTAALSRREIDYLFDIVRRLKSAGKAIIFISHKFDEVFAIADRYTVFRDGQFIGDGDVADVTQDDLVRMMVGRTLDEVFPKVSVEIGDVVMEVAGLSHPTEFDDISFTLRRGQILGFYGLVGAGRSEVMQALFGLTKPSAGDIKIGGDVVEINSPPDAINHGIAYVPESRQEHGVILPLSVRINLTLPHIAALSWGPFLNPTGERTLTEQFGERLSIKAAHWEQAVEELSGGNQQKVVIGKWLATNPRIIILDEPTKGIDIGAKALVHGFMGELVKAGLAVILVSSELEEILGMADDIVVMHRGRIQDQFRRDDASAETIVRVATGAQAA